MTTGRINQVTALAARTSTRCASTSSRVRSPSDSCSRPTRSTKRLPSATTPSACSRGPRSSAVFAFCAVAASVRVRTESRRPRARRSHDAFRAAESCSPFLPKLAVVSDRAGHAFTRGAGGSSLPQPPGEC